MVAAVSTSQTKTDEQAQFLTKKLHDLEKDLKKAAASCANEMKEALTENIYHRYDEAIHEASTNAVPTAAT
jgi:hypothetical protein